MAARALSDHIEIEMILQIGADTWQVMYDGDADRGQMIRRTDAG